MSEEVTLQEAAELLGVHYMTAYRYVRLGLLPGRKEGGTWRVVRTDLAEFSEAPTAPRPSGKGVSRSARRAPWAERLEARLLAGDSRGAWGVVEAALSAGSSLEAVYLDLLCPALASIGERWRAGEIDVAVEHRASGIAMRLIGRIGPRFTRRGRTRGSIVMGTAAGERHSLQLAVLADLARMEGFEVSDLGADVPPASFAFVVRDTERLALICISAMTPGLDDSVAETISVLRETAPSVPILLGGLAIADREHALRLGADAYANDGRALVELLGQPPTRAPQA